MNTDDSHELERFVSVCRRALEGLAGKVGSPFMTFPSGCCGDASELLGYVLLERLGLQCTYICGSRHPQLGPHATHAWLETGNVIIDITHDQCANTGLVGWILHRTSRWHRQFRKRDVGSIAWNGNLYEGHQAIDDALGKSDQ
jgi:hypothetical protein